MPMDQDTRELHPRLLPLSAKSRALLTTFSDTVERAQAPGGDCETISGYASKAAEQAARIAGVLTLWSDLDAQEVNSGMMEAGISLARFYLLEAQRLAGVATISAAITKAEELRKWMLSPSWRKDWLTAREVVNRGPIRLRESLEAKATIAILAQHGWLDPLPAGTVIEGRARREAWTIRHG